MEALREEARVGLAYLEAVTELLRRTRSAHPTKGLYEAPDFHWWWRTPRSTDVLKQLFWFDQAGRPEAAVIATDWGKRMALAPVVMPDAAPSFVAHMMARGLAHAVDLGLGAVQLEVDCDDEALTNVLTDRGFVREDEGIVEAWLDAAERPEITPLAAGYRLSNRLDENDQPHHMIVRSGPAVDERLNQTSLYRPDFDLFVRADDESHAAHGLFWHDPETAIGLVEPMRTESDHQRKGLARHVITTGVNRLADAGAERIKICFESDNAGARDLYLSVGFQPVKQTVMFSGDVRQ